MKAANESVQGERALSTGSPTGLIHALGAALLVSCALAAVSYTELDLGHTEPGVQLGELLTYLYSVAAGVILVRMKLHDGRLSGERSKLLLGTGIAGLAVLPLFTGSLFHSAFDDTGQGGLGLFPVFMIGQLLALAIADAVNRLRVHCPEPGASWKLILTANWLSVSVFLVYIAWMMVVSGSLDSLVLCVPFLILYSPVLISTISFRRSADPLRTARTVRRIILGIILAPTLLLALAVPFLQTLFVLRYALFLGSVFAMLSYGFMSCRKNVIEAE